MNRMILTIIALVFGLCTAIACASGAEGHDASGAASGVDVHGEIEHGGYTRTYMVHVPKGYSADTPVPLVLSFHGRHGQGEGQAKLTGFSEVADRHGFIVVYPDGIEKSWNAMHGAGPAQEKGVDDVGFVEALIDRLQADYAIDPKRVYAAGMSNGGFFSHRLGCELSPRLAAIASVAGEMGPELAKVCQPEYPIAVLDIHGTKDRIVPYDGGETKGGGELLSVEDTVDVWRQLNDCALRSDVTLEKGDVVCRTFRECTAPVEQCTVEGAGHTWPGGYQYLPRLLIGTTNRDVDASELIWEFFENNPKRISVRQGSERKQPVERQKYGGR